MLQKARGVYFNAKVLNLDDAALGRTVRNSYIMMVKCSVTHFSVMIVEMHTLKSIFHFKFKHTAPIESDIYVTPVTQVSSCSKLEEIKQHVIDAVKNLNSEQVQEHIESNHVRIRQNRALRKAGVDEEEEPGVTFEAVLFKVQECAAHAQRFYQRNLD